MTTNESLETLVENLESLRLPELQACFKQVVGKATRSPNRKFLMRTIREEFLMHKIREAAAARRVILQMFQGPTVQGQLGRQYRKLPLTVYVVFQFR